MKTVAAWRQSYLDKDKKGLRKLMSLRELLETYSQYKYRYTKQTEYEFSKTK